MSPKSPYIAKQMLAGGKGTKNIRRPCVDKLSAPEWDFVYCSKGTHQKWKVGFHGHLHMDEIERQAGSLHSIFPFDLPSLSFSHKMFPVLNTGLESLGVSN